jgi:NAD-dependent deacetylase
MPQAAMARATEVALDCDLLIVLGSSLVVYPAAGFPLLAKENGAKLAIVNREATEQDLFADLVIHDEIGSVVAALAPLD